MAASEVDVGGGEIADALMISAVIVVLNECSDHVLAAGSAGGLIGFATVLPPENGIAEVEDLFVDPEFWRQGVATLLMKVAEERPLTNGASHTISLKRSFQFFVGRCQRRPPLPSGCQ